jgi:hypothetical protein
MARPVGMPVNLLLASGYVLAGGQDFLKEQLKKQLQRIRRKRHEFRADHN